MVADFLPHFCRILLIERESKVRVIPSITSGVVVSCRFSAPEKEGPILAMIFHFPGDIVLVTRESVGNGVHNGLHNVVPLLRRHSLGPLCLIRGIKELQAKHIYGHTAIPTLNQFPAVVTNQRLVMCDVHVAPPSKDRERGRTLSPWRLLARHAEKFRRR